MLNLFFFFSVKNGPVQSLSRVWLFKTPWTTARQASLSITNCQSLPKPMSIESVIPSNHLLLCHPLLLPPSIFPIIRVFSSKSALHIRWPKYWSFTFGINLPMNNQHWFPLGLTGWISLQSKGLSALSNSMKSWTMPCRATQAGPVMVESSDKMWSIAEGNGKPLQYSCLENPMNCSLPGFPVHHQLLEPAQTHVHWVDDAIQPSHPMSFPSPAFNLSQ